MKDVVMFLVCNLTSAACVVAALWLAFKGQDGWGWFLFVAVLTHGTVKYTVGS